MVTIPKVDFTSATNVASAFHNSLKLRIIEEIVSSATTPWQSNTFQNCSALTHIIFSGVIASDINLQWSKKLDLESLISLFSCLKQFAPSDANFHTKTLTLSAESWALTVGGEFESYFEVSNGKQLAQGLGWNVA
jgi:hypothetical protein